MPIRLFAYALTAAVASFLATIGATALYMVVVLHEPADFMGSLFFGLNPALRGIVLAVPAGIVFSFVRRTNRLLFTSCAAITAALLGALLGVWVVGSSPHVSALLAASFLAMTWGLAASTAALFAKPSPN